MSVDAPATGTPTRLGTSALSVGYQSVHILHDVTVEIPAGRITALIGANGCGKSTLLKTIARVLGTQGGAVLLDGREVESISRRAFALKLAALPQSPIAPEGLTVRELCRFGRHPHRGFAGRPGKGDDDAISRALANAGMSSLADAPLDELSGGQRQRAWIAMALAQETEILLLDEPTTYLDIAHQTDVLRLVQRLNSEHGRTIVMVLHDLNQAARYAHHIIAVAGGGIAAEGPPSEVIVPEVIKNVFGLECAVVSNPLNGTPLCLPLD